MGQEMHTTSGKLAEGHVSPITNMPVDSPNYGRKEQGDTVAVYSAFGFGRSQQGGGNR